VMATKMPFVGRG